MPPLEGPLRGLRFPVALAMGRRLNPIDSRRRDGPLGSATAGRLTVGRGRARERRVISCGPRRIEEALATGADYLNGDPAIRRSETMYASRLRYHARPLTRAADFITALVFYVVS